MEYYIPEPSNRAHKKYMVKVWDGRNNKDIIVHFGHTDYEDYTQHNDESRRNNYLSRSAGITDKYGHLTKDDPTSANYWSRRYLWASGEPWYIYLPPNYRLDNNSNTILLN